VLSPLNRKYPSSVAPPVTVDLSVNRISNDWYVCGILEMLMLAASLANVVDASSTGMLAVEWT